jgi:hypothetical protein
MKVDPKAEIENDNLNRNQISIDSVQKRVANNSRLLFHHQYLF